MFSSSKETCALRQSLLLASTLEVLQVLKQLYDDEQLNFSSHLLAKEDDYAIDNAKRGQFMNLYLWATSKNCRTCLKLWTRTGHSTTTLHIVYRLKDTLQAIVVTAKHLENQNIFIASPALRFTCPDHCITSKSDFHHVSHPHLDSPQHPHP